MNTLKMTVLMAGLTALFLAAGKSLGGPEGVTIALIAALTANLLAYFFSDSLVLAAYGAREVTPSEAPRLHEIVAELTQAANIPMPRLFVIASASPNAFATGRSPRHAAVAVTEGILELLSARELRAVLGHELAHVHNRDILIGTVAAVLAGALSMLAHMAHWAFLWGGYRGDRDNRRAINPVSALLTFILAPLAAALIQLAISRAREFQADESGARLHGDPRDLARALRKLSTVARRIPFHAEPATAHLFLMNPLRGDSLTGLFSTHPPIEERIRRLEILARRKCEAPA